MAMLINRGAFYIFIGCFLIYFLAGCDQTTSPSVDPFEPPSVDHDLSYIPFDASLDHPSFEICDDTQIFSGRNRIRYDGGLEVLRNEISENFRNEADFSQFNGFVVIRFLVNCKGETGRFRLQAMNSDFSPRDAPTGLFAQLDKVFKRLDHWIIDGEAEYSKFVNLKFEDGQIQYVLL